MDATNIATIRPSLDTLEPPQLLAHYSALITRQRDLESRGEQLTDDDLIFACEVLKALRRKSVGPPKAAKTRKLHISASDDDL